MMNRNLFDMKIKISSGGKPIFKAKGNRRQVKAELEDFMKTKY